MQLTEANATVSLCNLLGYAEDILKEGERIISDLSRDAEMAAFEHEVTCLEGVSAPGGDDCWLSISRLRENPAPEPAEPHAPWVAKTPGAPVFDPPRLSASSLVRVSIEESSDLVEAGLALPDDVMPRRGEGADDTDSVDILLRLVNLPEFTAEFDTWVAGPWTEWAEAEKPRRRSIAFYNRLFEIQQRMESMGDDVPSEAIMGVGIARWNHPGGRVNVPLIEAAVELELDPENGALVVRARPQAPRLALRPFVAIGVEGVGKLDREARAQLEALYTDADVGFSPYERDSFEPVLRMCHARLSSASVYERDAREDEGDRTPPKADDKLRISDTWVLYIRKRSADFRCDDIRRLIAAVKNVPTPGDLPAPAVQMTSVPQNKRVDGDIVNLGIGGSRTRGGSGTSTTPLAASVSKGKDEVEFFFPLPYNDDQIEIVRRLEDDSICGVVVQGPPGTGKTHTIANIIAHYMATGRRVLVSAYAPEALSAIQAKLPASIRDLAISVIHSDREGARQLEQAVEILASQVKQIDKRAYNDRRIDLEDRLAAVRVTLADVDQRVRQYADVNLASVDYGGARLIPMDLATRIEAERPLHTWFPDGLGLEPQFEPVFSSADIAEARRIRIELGADLAYTSNHLPRPGELPDVPRLLAAHTSLARERAADAKVAEGDLPYISFGAAAGVEDARALHAWIEEVAEWTEGINPPDLWLMDLYRLLTGVKADHATVRDGMRKLCQDWGDLHAQGRSFILRGIEIPDVPVSEAAFDAALESLAQDRKPFGVFSFGKSALKAHIEAVRIDGGPPNDAAAWGCIRDYRGFQQRAHGFAGRWSAASRAVGFPLLPSEWAAAAAELVRLGAAIERMHKLHLDAGRHLKAVAALFPHGVDATRVVYNCEIAVVRESLALNLAREDHADAREVRRALETISKAAQLPFHAAVNAVLQSLGDPIVAQRVLAEAWSEILEEAKRLGRLRAHRTRLDAIAAAVRTSGAPNWSAALIGERAEDQDAWTPEGWRATWEWARAAGHIKRISDRTAFAALSAKRVALEDEQRTLLAEIVRIRTFIGLKQGITEVVASALTKFAMKVRQLGAGTGKAAERHRRAIREATLEAAGAVPCWILPEWRVAEQLPSELANFDLVIIDEASQSDITSLPTVLRGKKLLIVGDDKQVSPSAVGMEEKTVVQLRETYLRGMPIANYLEPTTSLYDFASMTFPGSVIMLREHFRCVEPIIRFSSRFYPKALVPLRVPTAAERLDPPLIDIYVPGGRKVREVNESEASVIVDEIVRLVEDPAYASRTFGVISLIGDKQAKLVMERLTAAIGTDAIARHRIMCGNASTFQGQERDIIFLSMVACPATARAQTARPMEQRFNVAMSRARDRLYLVRSVAASRLSKNDLKAAIIEHFRNPMETATVAQPKDVLESCDSDFEREVGGRLLDLGYRVQPQVQVGGFRIDFVVEGEGDRRLAVELDGDRYHGPDRWAADLHRQRALERMGWTFWRCWGSHWLADREGCLQELLDTLTSLGIEPIGGEFSPHVWTEHRVVGGGVQPSEAAQQGAASTGSPVLVQGDFWGEEKVDGKAAAIAETEPSPFTGPERAGIESESLVEAGDTIIVRFADDNRVRRFRLSREANNPENGIVHISQPIGEALLGNGLDDEVELHVGGQSRTVIIEKITKAA